MAKAGRIELAEEDLRDLRIIVRSKKADRRMVDRVREILCWNEGKSFARTEAEIGMMQMTINKWRKQSREHGLKGLFDATRSGKPPKFSAAEKARVIQLATRPAGDGYTNLSQRQIAKRAGRAY